MKPLYLAVLLALAGCTTTPEAVKVPVAVGCMGERPARPSNQFGAGPYPGDKAAAQLALQDSAAWESYANQLEAATAGCRPKDEVLK